MLDGKMKPVRATKVVKVIPILVCFIRVRRARGSDILLAIKDETGDAARSLCGRIALTGRCINSRRFRLDDGSEPGDVRCRLCFRQVLQNVQ